MCGLAGVALGQRHRTPAQYEQIWRTFTRLLVCAQSRGRDAAGVAVVQRDGTYSLHKESVRADELVTHARYERIGARLGDETTVILGHARLVTKGSPLNPANNHPIYLPPMANTHGSVLGIHNGQIRNESYLFLKYEYERAGEVDSEILFHLAGEACRFRASRRLMLRAYLGELLGQAAALWVMLEEPEQLYVLRKRQPLCASTDPSLGVVYFASLRKCMQGALPNQGAPLPVPDEELQIFDVSKSLPDMQEPRSLPIPSPEQELEKLSFEDLRSIAEATGYLRKGDDAIEEESGDDELGAGD